MTTLAVTIKNSRAKLGITQSVLAGKLNMTAQAISNIELGKSGIGRKNFKQFGSALRLKPIVLVNAWLTDLRTQTLKDNGIRIAKVQ